MYERFGISFTGCWLVYEDGCLVQRQYIVKMNGNVSDWLSYAGGSLIKVVDSAGSTVCCFADWWIVARDCMPSVI